MSVKKQLGSPKVAHGTWVQTDRAAHQAWAQLAINNPKASALLHVLIGYMGAQNAVVISRGALSKLVGCSESTIKRAVTDLRAGQWIEVVQLGGKGGVNAYIVNARVAWAQKREDLHGALFQASVFADMAEQFEVLDAPLRKIPVLFPGERQLPSGPGAAPPSQPDFEGLEADLPALQRDPNTIDAFTQTTDSETSHD